MTVVATEATREEWEAEFWGLYAPYPGDLATKVGDFPGIHVRLRLVEPLRPLLRASYGRYSGRKLRRVSAYWRGKTPPADLVPTLEEFARDEAAERAAHERIWVMTLRRLPRAPSAYYWTENSGCLIWGDARGLLCGLTSSATGHHEVDRRKEIPAKRRAPPS